jgi:hypothetical protein
LRVDAETQWFAVAPGLRTKQSYTTPRAPTARAPM